MLLAVCKSLEKSQVLGPFLIRLFQPFVERTSVSIGLCLLIYQRSAVFVLSLLLGSVFCFIDLYVYSSPILYSLDLLQLYSKS